jgi:hypothetical protein
MSRAAALGPRSRRRARVKKARTPPAAWDALANPELVGIGVDHDLGAHVAADREERHGFLGAIRHLMRRHCRAQSAVPRVRRALGCDSACPTSDAPDHDHEPPHLASHSGTDRRDRLTAPPIGCAPDQLAADVGANARASTPKSGWSLTINQGRPSATPDERLPERDRGGGHRAGFALFLWHEADTNVDLQLAVSAQRRETSTRE